MVVVESVTVIVSKKNVTVSVPAVIIVVVDVTGTEDVTVFV